MLSTSTFLTFLLIFTRYSITSALDLCDPADAFQLSETSNGFTVTLKDREVLKHPFLYVGEGETDYREFHGDFFQKDYLEYKTPLNNFEIVHGDRKNENSSDFVVILDGVYEARFFCSQKDSVQEIKVVKVDESSAVNRVWVRFIGKVIALRARLDWHFFDWQFLTKISLKMSKNTPNFGAGHTLLNTGHFCHSNVTPITLFLKNNKTKSSSEAVSNT